jgi:hypothetical protein
MANWTFIEQGQPYLCLLHQGLALGYCCHQLTVSGTFKLISSSNNKIEEE